MHRTQTLRAMTERKIDDTIAAIRRTIHLRVAASAIGSGAFWSGASVAVFFTSGEAFGCLIGIVIAGMIVAGVSGASILGRTPTAGEAMLAGPLFVMAVAFVVAGAFAVSKALKTPRSLLVWQYFLKRFVAYDAVLLDPTAAVAERLAVLFRDGDETVLRLEQGARLLDLHHKEQRRKAAVDENLQRFEKLAGDLRSRVSDLRALRERSESGEVALSETERVAKGLRHVSAQLGRSLSVLESILASAEGELKARQLHREIDALARAAHTGSVGPSAELEVRDATRRLERQIAAEIDVYVGLERDARRALDNVRLVGS